MLLLLLYCLPLLFKVDRGVGHVLVVVILSTITVLGGSCCCCYSFNHYCCRFDRGVVHVVVVILSTITVLGLTEQWFMM